MKKQFHKLSIKIADVAGSTWAFVLAIAGILIWVISGPYYHFSNTWLISISTITDLVMFIVVFSIQNTQNRDSKAIQLKLNELIVADKKARDAFIGLESLTDDELTELDNEFKQLLSSLEVAPAMHKLHSHIRKEKEHRFNLTQEAGHLVGSLLGSLVTATEKEKVRK